MELPREVPVMILPNAILFPGALLPLYIFENRYRRLLSDALHTHRMFAVAMRKPGRSREIPSPVAGLGLIRVAVTRQDGTSYLLLQGLARVGLEKSKRLRPYRVQQVYYLQPDIPDSPKTASLMLQLRKLVAKRLQNGFPTSSPHLEHIDPLVSQKTLDHILSVSSLESFLDYLGKMDDPGQMADLVSCTLLSDAEKRQTVLETLDVESRLRRVIWFLSEVTSPPEE